MTRLVLVNAIYLKAAWQTPFEDGATAPAPSRGSTPPPPTFHDARERPFQYAAGTGWQAVELPYVGGKLSMVIIVPDDLAAFEKTLDGAALARIIGVSRLARSSWRCRSSASRSKLDLGPVLAALGMPTAFTDAADFSGITKERRSRSPR